MGSLSGFHWIIFAVIFGGLFFHFYRALNPNGKTCICPSCGTTAKPLTKYKGSLIVEIVLWLCFIVPGLIYSVWRISSKHSVCPACRQAGMIPIDTPNGKRLYDQFMPSHGTKTNA